MLVSLVQSEVIALSLNIYVVAKPTRFKKGPCCWMLHELVQQSGVSKSEWVLRPPSKFQTRLDFFFTWVEGMPFSYNVFLYPSHLLVSLGNPPSQCSLFGEWNHALPFREGTELPLTTVCPKLSQGSWLWWGPSVGLVLLQICVGVSVPWDPDQHWKWLK